MTGNPGEFNRPYEMDEVLHIASSIAERQMHDMLAAQKLSEEITGHPFSEVPFDIQQKVATAAAAMNIAKLESPERRLTFEESLDAVMEGSYGLIAELVSEEAGGEVSDSQIREYLLGFGKTLLNEAGITDEDTSNEFENMFGCAKEISDEKGVSIAEVYQNEDLYTEIFRRLYTTEEYAANQVEMLGAISEKTMNSIIVHGLNATITKEDREQMSADEITEMMAEIQLDPEFQAMLRKSVDVSLKVTKHLAVVQIIRIWGNEALRNLPEDIQKALGVTLESSAIHIGGFVLEGVSEEDADILRMRESFVKHFFEERGWDFNNPTQEQLLDACSQPGWQNPTI